jgi:Fe-S cluster biogenesis protein NfuA
MPSGDVKLVGISGSTVSLALLGACNSCASSSVTMRLGLEASLKLHIPDITHVIQVQELSTSLPSHSSSGPTLVLDIQNLDAFLDTIRPLIAIAGGGIEVVAVHNNSQVGVHPSIRLKVTGAAAVLNSVKMEIVQRIQRHFLQTVQVVWET